ncbi:MAG: PIN domain-containing protein [Nanoarchaeota archaeon]
MILDSSFLIDLLCGKEESVKQKARSLDQRFVVKAITSISVMELWRGVLKKGASEEEKRKVKEIISSYLLYSFDEKAAQHAAEIESELSKNGEIIDLEDIMIAGIAQSKKESILTRNQKHFQRIKDLEIETY